MIQLSLAAEMNIGGRAGTLAVGWGLNTFANVPWYGNLFGIVRQGATGIRRYGLIVLGFFVTFQYADIPLIQAAAHRAASAATSSVLKRALKAGAAVPRA